MKILVYCRSCKNFVDYGYSEIDGEMEEVTSCELGRYVEHRQAEKNNWLTECDYYE